MAFLAPLFFVGLAAVAVPILVHLIQRERKTVIEFPSLMFLRKIPYQSVERRRIHNWPLLLLRAAAMTLLVAAFTRPFFKMDPLQAAIATSGAREVLILLDRSASMGYGDHFAKAKAEAKKIVDTIGADDKATVILFGTGAEEVVRGASDRGRLAAAIDAATVSSDGTRYAPVLRLAQSKLSQSTLPRKEAYLITDFQKTGWERQEEIHMPQGATLTPVSVASPGVSDLSVSSVAFQRTSFSGEERVTITAGLTNRSPTAVTSQPVKLEIDGRVVDTRPVTIEPNASGSVTFAQVTASVPGMRGTIRAGTDSLPKNNDFHFALSPSRPVSVLIIQGEGAASDASFYLTTVLSIGTAPPFKAEVVTPSRVTAASFERRSVVVLNDTTALSTQTTDLLKRFVEQGGGLFISLKDRTPWSGTDMPLMPGTPGPPVDRLGTGTGGGTLGFLDYSHPIFDEFKDPRNGNFSSVRFYRYRGLAPGPADKVLARFDDGAAAMIERSLGSGRIIAFTSPFDASWNTFPQAHLFLPLVHETARYLAQYEEPEAWYTVGRMLDISVPIAAMVREGTAGDAQATSRKATGVVMSPAGEQVALGDGGRDSVELLQQGFYSVRLQGMGERRPFQVAVNLDPAESDLSALPPAEFVNTVTGRVAAPPVGGDLEHPELTPADMEKKQSLWWFLFVAGAAALLAEAILANRLSKRFGFGLLQTGKTT